MNRFFAAGAATGMAVTVVASLAFVLLRPAGRAPSAAGDRRENPARQVEQRVIALERELVVAREEARAQRARADELRIRLEELFPAGIPPAPAPPAPRPLSPAERAAQTARESGARGTGEKPAVSAKELRSLRALQLGKELPPEVVDWLELDSGQKSLTTGAFEEDGKRVYSSLRTLASAELPWMALPKEDGYDLAATVYQVMNTEPRLRRRWESWRTSLLDIRGETLDRLGPALREEQKEKLSSLLANYFSFEGSFTFTASR